MTMGQNHNTDTRLSLRARGLMGYLLTLPPDAPMGAETLANDLPEGRDAITRALRELRDSGYLRRTRTGNQVTGLSGNPTTGLSGNQGSGNPENPSVIEEELLTTTSSMADGFSGRLTERVCLVMGRLGIAVSAPWQDAWEQAVETMQGYDPETHLVDWLLDAEEKGRKTNPATWLMYFRRNRDEWLRANAEAELRANAQEFAYRQEQQDFLNLRNNYGKEPWGLPPGEKEAFIASFRKDKP